MTELDQLEVSGGRHHGSLPNGNIHHVNGISCPQVVPGGGGETRSVHDGFATIRSGGGKRGRCRSSPSITADTQHKSKCCGCNNGSTSQDGRVWKMEPLWEEKTAPAVVLDPSGTVNGSVPQRRQKTIPWWEVATRRSKYRSCPAFSQANVVSALEQTVTNVTSQLEKLASSPDLKEAEAEELRRTAAVLREQSSAVYQSINSSYFTMERQLSCDSVSSVTSTLSGTSLASYASLGSHHHTTKPHHHHNHSINTHHHQPQDDDPSKMKKRNWLRSSFRRAFSRRKRSKPCHEDAVNGNNQSVIHNNCSNIPVSHQNGQTLNKLNQRCNNSVSCNYSKSLPRSSTIKVAPPPQHSTFSNPTNNITNRGNMEDLRQKLANKERELTDCHLELLSAKHVVQNHEDTIQRLQAEVAGLRSENSRLANLVNTQHSVDSLVAPLTQAVNSMTLSKHSSTTSCRDNGRNIRVVVLEGVNLRSITEAKPVICDTTCVSIGQVTVMPNTSWSQLDNLISEALRNYCLRIDPGTGLGINGVDILCYCLDEILRGNDQSLPELLPYGYCVGNVDQIYVWLKSGFQKSVGASVGSVASCAFSSGIPASWLRDLLGSLQETRRLVLAGPPASGKSALAKAIASLYVTSAGQEVNQSSISLFKVNGNNTLELCQLLSSVWPHGLISDVTSRLRHPEIVSHQSSQHTRTNFPPPSIIIIDDLHAAGGVVETLQRCLPSSGSGGPAIIATTNPMPSLATRLQVHCNFRWANLGVLQEPLRGFLGRTTRRKIVSAEEHLGIYLPKAHHTAEWLTQLWLHINTLLSTHLSTDAVLGPGIFINCPVDQTEAQPWFTQTWNNIIVPHILEIIQATPTFISSWTDPVEWILSTYPWPVTAAIGPNQLLKIHSEDIIRTTAANRSITSALRSYQLSSNWQQNRGIESIYSTPVSPPQGVIFGSGSTLPSSTSAYTTPNLHTSTELTIKPTLSIIKPSSNGPVKPSKLNLENCRPRSYSTSSSSSSFTSSTVKTNSCGASPTSDLDLTPKSNEDDADEDMNVDIKELFSSTKSDEIIASRSKYPTGENSIYEEIELKNNINNAHLKSDLIINVIPSQTNTIKEVSSDLTSTFKSI